MRKTTKDITPTIGAKLTVDTNELAGMLSCGRATAVKIGMEAKARIAVGRRVLWNIEKIQSHLDRVQR